MKIIIMYLQKLNDFAAATPILCGFQSIVIN